MGQLARQSSHDTDSGEVRYLRSLLFEQLFCYLAILDLELALTLRRAERDSDSASHLEAAFTADPTLLSDAEFFEGWLDRHLQSYKVDSCYLRALMDLLVAIEARHSSFVELPSEKLKDAVCMRILKHAEDLQARIDALEIAKLSRDRQISEYRNSRSFRLGQTLLSPLAHAQCILFGKEK